MQDSVATAHTLYKQGQTYDLSNERALKLIAKGLAKQLQREERQPVKRKTTSLPHGNKG